MYTIQMWLNKWLEVYVRGYKAQDTYSCYKNAIRVVVSDCPETLAMPVTAMTDMWAQELLYKMANTRSKSQINHVRVVLHQASAKAYQAHLCASSIGYLMIPRHASQKVIVALSRAQEDIVRTTAEHVTLGHIALFFLETGLRREEFEDLTWHDVSLSREEICVRHSKTQAGVRVVPLSQLAMRILLTQPHRHVDDFVFHDTHGNHVSDESLKKLYMRLRRETGVTSLTTHVYRHTFATRALENGMQVEALSKILGHKDVAFTINRYCRQPDAMYLHDQMRHAEQTRLQGDIQTKEDIQLHVPREVGRKIRAAANSQQMSCTQYVLIALEKYWRTEMDSNFGLRGRGVERINV